MTKAVKKIIKQQAHLIEFVLTYTPKKERKQLADRLFELCELERELTLLETN